MVILRRRSCQTTPCLDSSFLSLHLLSRATQSEENMHTLSQGSKRRTRYAEKIVTRASLQAESSNGTANDKRYERGSPLTFIISNLDELKTREERRVPYDGDDFLSAFSQNIHITAVCFTSVSSPLG